MTPAPTSSPTAPPRHAALPLAFLGALALTACLPPVAATEPLVAPPSRPPPAAPPPAPCEPGPPMTVRFYDAGQALAALVELPDGRRVVVDAGESPTRAACEPCARWHRHVVDGLERDLAGAPIDLLWITHPHSDHVGGAADVIDRFTVKSYVDNGRDAGRAAADAHDRARARGVVVAVVDPARRRVPLASSPRVRLTAVVPAEWPKACVRGHDENECSIGLRIDYCRSSVLFVGDAGRAEEAGLEPLDPATLLQVGHHGSDTSSTEAFVARVRPSYAVISCARPGEGTNRGYCHPRRAAVDRLTAATGGPGRRAAAVFDGETSCRQTRSDDWADVPTSDRLWITARDGDVVLVTSGDGRFERAVGGNRQAASGRAP